MERTKRAYKELLAQTKALAKSRFVEMFGGAKEPKSVELSAVSEISSGLTKNSKREKLPLRYQYLRVANVFFNKLDLTDVAEIGVEEKEIEKNLLAKDDLLFVEGNGSKEQIGRVAIWDGSIEPCLHQNHLIKARFNGSVVPEYALHYFMSQDGRKQVLDAAVSTSGLHTLSTGKISKFKLPLPPLPLQREFADFIAQLDKSEFALKQSLEKLTVAQKALMNQAFRGTPGPLD